MQSGQIEQLELVSSRQESKVSDPNKSFRQDVQSKSSDKASKRNLLLPYDGQAIQMLQNILHLLVANRKKEQLGIENVTEVKQHNARPKAQFALQYEDSEFFASTKIQRAKTNRPVGTFIPTGFLCVNYKPHILRFDFMTFTLLVFTIGQPFK